MRIPGLGGRRGVGGLGGRWTIILVIVAGIAVYWFSNQQVGIGGRKQLITMGLDQEVQLGQQAYMQLLQSEPILCGPRTTSCSTDAKEVVATIEEVGQRIRKAALDWEAEGAPMTMQGQSASNLPSWGSLADKFDWQFNVIQSDTPNAFALPGGYVAFYTGILPTAKNVDGVAVIMGHEVGHALARHGAERMSQQQLMQIGQMAVGASIGDLDPGTQRAVMGAFGMAAQGGVMLPFSREHESQADMIGLELLVRACYDPREAPLLWERMAELGGGGQRPPEVLSTHPDPATRAKAFAAVMPTAIAEFEKRCGPLPQR
jgi:metalloendopeptidase OMA1, mitochondrial